MTIAGDAMPKELETSENTVLFVLWDHKNNPEQINYRDASGKEQSIYCYSSERHGLFYVDGDDSSAHLGICYVEGKPVQSTYYCHPDFESEIDWGEDTYYAKTLGLPDDVNVHQFFTRVLKLPEDFDFEDILRCVSDERPEWCDICNDWMRTESCTAGGNGCTHVYWCDECSMWTGPGSEDGDCDHIHAARACPNRSKRRTDEHIHIYDWELVPDPITTFCILCGHETIITGPPETIEAKIKHDPKYNKHIRCQWCGNIQSEYTFLKKASALPREQKIVLPCWRKGCNGQVTLAIADLAISVGAAGNGPYSYSLANRWGLKRAECSVCQKHWDGYEEDFFKRYHDQLKTAIEAMLAEQQGS